MLSEVKVSLELDEELTKKYNLSIPQKILEEKIESELLKIQKTYKLNGFRVGHVPMEIIKNKEKNILVIECGQRLMEDVIVELEKENNYKTIEAPDVTIKALDSDKAIEFDVTFNLYPDIPEIDLSTIEISEPPIEATEEQIKESLDYFMKNNATFEEQPDTYEAKKGDAIKIDLIGKIDNKDFEGNELKDYQLIIGSNSFEEKFEEEMIGKKTGDHFKTTILFPENYKKDSVAGKSVDFDVKVLTVSKVIQQELTDELVKKSGFMAANTVEEFKDLIKSGIKYNNERRYALLTRDELSKKLIEKLDFAIPKNFLDKLKNLNKEISEDNIINEVRLSLFLEKFIETNDIKITESEIETSLLQEAIEGHVPYEKLIGHYKNNKKAALEFRTLLLKEKAMDFIIKEKIKKVAKE